MRPRGQGGDRDGRRQRHGPERGNDLRARGRAGDGRGHPRRRGRAGCEGDRGAARFRRLDVTSASDWEAVVAATERELGKVDILVNNAGISGTYTSDLASSEAWDRVMDINAKGVFLGMQHVHPAMRRAGGGAIVNISSISGFTGKLGVHMAYNASKGAVRIMTKAAAGVPVGARWDPRELRASRLHASHADVGRAGPGKSRMAREGARHRADASRGPRGGGRARRAVPRLGRGLLHHWHGAGGGRRLPWQCDAARRPVPSRSCGRARRIVPLHRADGDRRRRGGVGARPRHLARRDPLPAYALDPLFATDRRRRHRDADAADVHRHRRARHPAAESP